MLLRYRFTSMFYVAKSNPALHGDLYRGFLKAFDDGSYDRLFRHNPVIQTALSRANLDHRRIIEIDNPYLSRTTRGIPDRFWYRP